MTVRPITWSGRRTSATVADVATSDTGDRRQAVLAALRSAEQPRAVPELAELLGVHPNTVRFHLAALIERGQVERLPGRSTRPGRPRALFRALSVMDPDGPRQYRTLAAVLVADLAGAPEGSARATEAGRAWGSRIDPPPLPGLPRRVDARRRATEQLLALLDDYSFAPRLRDGADAWVELWNCPFLELAESAPEVVCAAHLGIMAGALAAWDAPLTADRLEPFAQPGCCLVHLHPTQPAS